MTKYKIIRDLEKHEQYATDPLKKGDIVYEFYGHTYGCIGPDGIAMCHDKGGPFFEIPFDAIEKVS